jgi:hypothetical protein
VDSDIFVVNVDDLLEHGTPPRNLTNDPTAVDEDPDWSPAGDGLRAPRLGSPRDRTAGYSNRMAS